MHGTAGCGKTVLSSTIIEDIKTRRASIEGSVMAYFYLQKASNFLTSITAQICAQLPLLSKEPHSLYRKCNSGSERPITEEVQITLTSVLKDTGPAFIIVDALDECPVGPEREELHEIVANLHRSSLENLYLLMTSRREFESAMEFLLVSPAISIESSLVNSDIDVYVQSKLEVIGKRKKSTKSLRAEVQGTLVERADGTF